MNVQLFTQPGAMADLHYAIGAFTGWDRVIPLLPLKWQLHLIVHKIDRSLVRAGIDRIKKRITFSLPDGHTFLITGAIGSPHAVAWRRTVDTRYAP